MSYYNNKNDDSEPREDRVSRGTSNDRTWHFDKSVSMGHIVSTIMLAGAVAGFMFSQNTKIETLAVRVNNNGDRIDRQELHHDADTTLIRDQLLRMEHKLDRVIEREQQ